MHKLSRPAKRQAMRPAILQVPSRRPGRAEGRNPLLLLLQAARFPLPKARARAFFLGGRRQPAPSPSAEEQEPSPSPSESGVIFEHVPEIIIPVPRTILYSNISGFPASYQDKLRALRDRYPDWVFTPVITNLNWDTVIAEESKSNKCTIQQSVDETSARSCAGHIRPRLAEGFQAGRCLLYRPAQLSDAHPHFPV